MVNDFDMAHLPGRSTSRVTYDYNLEWGFGLMELNKYLGGYVRTNTKSLCSVFVRVLLQISSLLQRVARENEVRVAVERL